MIKKKIMFSIITIFLLTFLIGIVNAQIYKQNQEINLAISCENLNCSENCQATVLYPNSSEMFFNETMTFHAGFLNITFNKTEALGDYSYFVDCLDSYDSGSFAVNPSGVELTTAQGILYSLLLIASFLFMSLAFYGSVSIDGKNKFQMGKLIEINYNKYIKQGLFFIAYLFLIFSTFFASEISQNFLQLGFFSTVLNWLHITLWIALAPIFIIFVAFSLIKWVADMNLMELSERGLKPYGQ